jgi:GT2 family glycosyltransferase
MSNVTEKIGVGITTCNRTNYFNQCLNSIDLNLIDHLVVVNDGDPFPFKCPSEKVTFIQNEKNLGVSKTKNKIFKFLLENNCKHIFTLEDDCIITDNAIFQKYISASKATGLKHFNFGPGSPWNRVQADPTVVGNLSKRHLSSQTGDPKPKLVIEYGSGVSVSLFEHVVAMFCYFESSSLRDVGLLNEEFYNAWEHVEHTLRYIKKGYYTPFWWFADITGSEKFIKEAKDEKANTSLAKNEEQFMKQVQDGLRVFHRLHGTVPSQIRPELEADVINVLKQIKKRK